MPRKIIGITIVAFVFAAVVILFLWNPEGAVWMPKCPFHLLTGYDCPGCGTSRALHHILHGRIIRGLSFNPALVVMGPYALLLLWLQYLGGARRAPRLYDWMTGRRTLFVLLAVLILYWVGRNLV